MNFEEHQVGRLRLGVDNEETAAVTLRQRLGCKENSTEEHGQVVLEHQLHADAIESLKLIDPERHARLLSVGQATPPSGPLWRRSCQETLDLRPKKTPSRAML